jgi:hypothetical protein
LQKHEAKFDSADGNGQMGIGDGGETEEQKPKEKILKGLLLRSELMLTKV